MTLIPCTECARHVRASESSCPFCGAAIDARTIDAIPEPQRFTGRAQMMSFRATAGAVAIAAAIGATGCGSSGPLYGAPPEDAATPAADAGTDAAPAPMYGAPPEDAGVDAASAALYGGPPARGGES